MLMLQILLVVALLMFALTGANAEVESKGQEISLEELLPPSPFISPKLCGRDGDLIRSSAICDSFRYLSNDVSKIFDEASIDFM
jgi:hypothetical protein